MSSKNIIINRETVVRSVEVREGNKVFGIFSNPKGALITLGKNSILIPNGAIGSHVMNELGAMLDGSNTGGDSMRVASKAKRTRRTKAEIEAANAVVSAEGDTNDAQDTNTNTNA